MNQKLGSTSMQGVFQSLRFSADLRVSLLQITPAICDPKVAAG